MARLDGKRALVTGGSRGIGAAICRYLAAEGAHVGINYVASADRAEALATEINTANGQKVAFAVQADIQEETAIQAMVAEVVERFGGIDILINNAGYESTVSAVDLSIDEWDRAVNTNLRGAFLCAQAAARAMIKQGTGGVIINNSSIHDAIPRMGLAHYCASKGGLEMLMKTLALEWAEFNIRVLNVSPGAIETEMNRDEIAAFGRERFESWIPSGRIGNVDEVAGLFAYLCSPEAAYINGTTIYIDGAYMINVVRYDPRKGAS